MNQTTGKIWEYAGNDTKAQLKCLIALFYTSLTTFLFQFQGDKNLAKVVLFSVI